MWERLPTKSRNATHSATIALVTAILEGYAEKAVFRGFSAHPERGGKATYRMVWHHDRPFELLLDVPGKDAAISGGAARRARALADVS